MFFHLTQLVDHGVIDNRTPGVVALRLWLKGEEHPMEFSLEGDCLRDIAGCKIEFTLGHETPANLDALIEALPLRNKVGVAFPGITGDITASNRIKIDKNKRDIFNSLYLEWFVDECGAFIIDSHLFEFSISLPSWVMDSCDEQVQIMTNQQVLRDYVLDWIDDYKQTPLERDPLPDHYWDKRLREAEGTAIIYQEIHKKYGSHPLGEIAEAFVMGWDSRLGKMADSDENGTAFSCKMRGGINIFDILDEEEALETQLVMSHPLFEKIIALTEHMHIVYASRLAPDKPPASQLAPEIIELFETVRYITPNVLSCLLQINGKNPNYSLLSERMSRCSQAIERSLAALKRSKEEISKLEEMLGRIHADTVSLQHQCAKQVNH